MKLSWLLPALLGGGAAPPSLDTAGITITDNVLHCEHRILLRQGTTDQQDKATLIITTEQCSPDDSSPTSNTISIDVDTSNNNNNKNPSDRRQNQNKTKPLLHTQPPPPPPPDDNDDSKPRVTFKPRSHPQTNHPDDSPPQKQSDPLPIPNQDPPAQTEDEPRIETKNPAPANRALAGMSAGLVSVMLVFVIFL